MNQISRQMSNQKLALLLWEF